MMEVREFDTVLLKDGRIASIVDVLSPTAFVADVGHDPETWETIHDLTIDDIEKIIDDKQNGNS